MGVKLGQKWAVKDGNLLASNQVGSRFFNKEFEFSRASNGTYVDRDGLLKTAELYNKFNYSEDFSGWGNLGGSTLTPNAAISPDGNLNATKITEGTNVLIYKSIAAGTYTQSFYAKKGTSDVFGIYTSGVGQAIFDLTNGVVVANNLTSASIQDVGNGWYRCIATSTSGSSTFYGINYNGVDGSTIYVYGAQLVEGTEPLDYQYTNGLQGLPRISFEDGVGHLLLEPQRSNLVTYSEDFSNAFWTKFNASVSSGFLSPDGLANAYKLIASVSNTEHRIRSASIATAAVGTTVTFSIYCKPQEITKIALVDNWTNLTYSVVNLLTNSVIEEVFYTGTGNTTITEMANGFKRISFTYKTANINTLPAVYLLDDSYTSGNPTSYTFASNGTSGVYIYGGMLEAADYLTSYIKTEGTSVTRLADVCNNSGSAQDFNSEEGVLYAEIGILNNDGTNRHIGISDGSYENRLQLFWSTSLSTEIRTLNIVNNVKYFDMTSSVTLTDGYAKVAIKYKENDFALWVNGVEAATDTSGLVWGSNVLNTLKFADGGGASPFYGKVRNVQVFTEALSDEELESLTQG